MTTKPSLRLGRHQLPGLVAVGLLVVFVIVILRSEFPEGVGFPEDESVVEGIGLALLHVPGAGIPAEGFLVALIAIAVVLDAALGGAVMLAARDEDVEDGGGAE